MQTVHVYINQDENAIEQSGFYLTGYHNKPIKIGDVAILVFDYPWTKQKQTKTCKVLDIRFQWWNGDDDPKTNPALDKYKLKETVPSHKNWLKVQPIEELREEKLNEILG